MKITGDEPILMLEDLGLYQRNEWWKVRWERLN